MGPLTFSINVTLDGCVDHRVGVADDEMHAFFTRLMDEAGAMLWGRVTYEMMESYWPAVACGDEQSPPAIQEWAVKLEAKPKYVVSSTREDFPWTNSHHVAGDLHVGVQQLKDASPAGVLLGSGLLATELDRLDLIDEYRFLVHPRIAGHGPTLFENGLPDTRRLARGSGALQVVALSEAGEEQDVVEIVNPRVGSLGGDLGAGVQLLGDLVVDAEHDDVAARPKLDAVKVDGIRDLFEQLERAGLGPAEFEVDRGERLVEIGELDLASLRRRDVPGASDLGLVGQPAGEAFPALPEASGNLGERVVEADIGQRVDVTRCSRNDAESDLHAGAALERQPRASIVESVENLGEH